MSKLIVEMELPCKIYYLGGLHGTPTCPIERRICKDQKNPPSWCPIIGVLPETHGRLIDADELKTHVRNVVKEIVDNSPTIVPAERKDDERTDKA